VTVIVAATEVQGRRADLEVCRQLVEALQSEGGLNVLPDSYAGDVRSYTYLIERSSAVVAARYHVLLVAKHFGRPIYPVVYHEKVAELLGQG
jgi:polysaccharide pyruvyl transferase WcaK-like protein